MPISLPAWRRRASVAFVAALIAGSSALLVPAGATTSLAPTEPGSPPVVRDTSLTVSVDRSAMTFYRASASAAFAPRALSAFILNTQTCRGDNPAGTNLSPRTTVAVTGPSGEVITSAVSSQRNISLLGLAGGAQPINGAPANTTYRGDFPDEGAFHGMTVPVDLTGQPAGVYTVTTTDQNMVKTGILGPCLVGTPTAGVSGGFTPGVQVSTTTFEYRPWAYTFKDVTGNGQVKANVAPKEFTFSVGSRATGVIQGGGNQVLYSLPDAASFALPADPSTCATDPESCLPSTAVECDPASGCVPRLMLINAPASVAAGNSLQGVFDLETLAFIALAEVDGSSRVLVSLGTQNDAFYRDVLTRLSENAATGGVDLASILATQVRVRNGGSETSLSLINGLQIDPTTAAGGVQVVSDATTQAGVILNIYSELSSQECTSRTATSSDPDGGDRFRRTLPNGYTVTKSDLLPEVPRVGALGAIAGGPIYHIVGKFGADPLVNTTGAIIGVDTAADEPNGYPVWINPFVSGANLGAARTLDYVGTATWSASESSLGALGCLSVNFMFGTGVALLNNSLPVGLGTLLDPISEPSPELAELTGSINEAVTEVIDTATANPVVADLLAQVTAALPLGDLP